MRHIDAVVEANKAAGGSFFNERTILYFKNKVLPTMYGGKYFISYDLMEDGEKVYKVRKVLSSGLIANATPDTTYTSKSAAHDAIRDLLGDAVIA